LTLFGTPIVSPSTHLFAERYDIIHANFPTPYLAAISAFAAYLKGIPSVLTWHNDLPGVTLSARLLVTAHNSLQYSYLGVYRRIIATSRAYALSSPTLAYYRRKVTIIPNGVDIAKFNPHVSGSRIREKHNLGERKVVLFVGSFGRWHKYKGVGLLIKAFRRASGTRNDLKLVLVGSGALVGEYKRMVVELGLEDIVVFAGFVEDDLLPEYYAASDLAVLPSSDRSEGFGLVLLEAMATGKPVIGSKVGGVVDVIREGTGFLFEPGRDDELATYMLQILSDESRSQQMGAAARRFAESNSWGHVVDRLEALYSDVSRQKSP